MEYYKSDNKRGILKMVNYKNAAFDRLDKRIDYLLNPKKSKQEWQRGHFIHTDKAMHDFEVIYNRHHPKGTRFFRQGILNFGVRDLPLDTAFKVGCEIFEKDYEQYPYLLCVHSDLPKHIHVHFLNFTVNMEYGTKWEQAASEFYKFRDYADSVLNKYQLPTLKTKGETFVDEYNVTSEFEEMDENGIIYPVQLINTNSTLPYQRIYYPSCTLVPGSFANQVDCRLDLPRLQNDIISGLTEIKKIIYGGGF